MKLFKSFMPKPTSKKTLWITDSWPQLAPHPRETTLRLMEAAWLLGLPTSWADKNTLYVKNGVPWIRAQKLLGVVPGRPKNGFEFESEEAVPVSRFAQVHYRPDPPVTLEYLERVRLLGRTGVRLVNPMRTLLECSEKLVPQELIRFAPASVVSSDIEVLGAFGKTHKTVVLKSLHGAQSKQVLLARFHSTAEQKKSTLALRQLGLSRGLPVLAQEFLPLVKEGELRAWFVAGQFLGAFKKFPLEGDFRVQIDRGSRIAVAEPTGAQRRVLKACAKYLIKNDVGLAAVDLVGQFISDFNITSPGLLVELETVHQRDFASKAIKILAQSRRPKI